MDLRQVFATNLRRFRRKRGISQEELAHEAKINRSYVSTLENGLVYVGLEIIEKLAKTLDVEPSEFLKKNRKPKPK